MAYEWDTGGPDPGWGPLIYVIVVIFVFYLACAALSIWGSG